VVPAVSHVKVSGMEPAAVQFTSVVDDSKLRIGDGGSVGSALAVAVGVALGAALADGVAVALGVGVGTGVLASPSSVISTMMSVTAATRSRLDAASRAITSREGRRRSPKSLFIEARP